VARDESPATSLRCQRQIVVARGASERSAISGACKERHI